MGWGSPWRYCIAPKAYLLALSKSYTSNVVLFFPPGTANIYRPQHLTYAHKPSQELFQKTLAIAIHPGTIGGSSDTELRAWSLANVASRAGEEINIFVSSILCLSWYKLDAVFHTQVVEVR
jgi:hypothetical protein